MYAYAKLKLKIHMEPNCTTQCACIIYYIYYLFYFSRNQSLVFAGCALANVVSHFVNPENRIQEITMDAPMILEI
jgi:acetamidase/formamidase